ncbi:hypothetical protein [Novosphingobium sp. TH158]|uniref:hypothetical protein n=1 Tax=Novosphingobium sp. TH158 TaxID=2067455 RepID=UPI000C7B61E1|nr:hypothetical protein [Novosphingobium sp. TH158]PLK26366.1 hypothetical protein C0V78_05340 [Novosphingobium sp. TH158]
MVGPQAPGARRGVRFRNFAAIDWSGAVGERHRGISVALCGEGDEAPRLVRPGERWSRQEVADWLLHEMPKDTLAGLDLGISLPFADRSGFFPEWDQSPPDARSLWARVEELCANDPHLSVTSFVDHPQAAHHFRRHGGREGRHFGGGRGRFRVTERAQEAMGCRPYSNFNLVGAAQVGKSSLSGMRMLHRISPRLPVWPVDPLPASGSVVVEIYTTIAALHAGRAPGRSKMRSYEELNAALAAFGSRPVRASGTVDDHTSDAILTAAWLRRAAFQPHLWNPPALQGVAQTEGWTFGAV